MTVAILLRRCVPRQGASEAREGVCSHVGPGDDKLRWDFMARCDGNHNMILGSRVLLVGGGIWLCFCLNSLTAAPKCLSLMAVTSVSYGMTFGSAGWRLELEL